MHRISPSLLAVLLFGFGHFTDAFAPGLWGMMLVYAAVVVVLGQLTWFRAVTELPAATVSTWAAIVPVIAIGFAWLLLMEVPDVPQIAGAVVILAGVAIARTGKTTLVDQSLAAG